MDKETLEKIKDWVDSHKYTSAWGDDLGYDVDEEELLDYLETLVKE